MNIESILPKIKRMEELLETRVKLRDEVLQLVTEVFIELKSNRQFGFNDCHLDSVELQVSHVKERVAKLMFEKEFNKENSNV